VCKLERPWNRRERRNTHLYRDSKFKSYVGIFRRRRELHDHATYTRASTGAGTISIEPRQRLGRRRCRASHLEQKGYNHKTLVNKLTTLKQVISWPIEAGHLVGKEPIKFPLAKSRITASLLLETGGSRGDYRLLLEPYEGLVDRRIAIALACTGLRISELAAIRWSDVDLQQRKVNLTDETAHADRHGLGRRQLKSGRSRSFLIHPDPIAVLVRLARKDAFIEQRRARANDHGVARGTTTARWFATTTICATPNGRTRLSRKYRPTGHRLMNDPQHLD
jgi:integrase